MDKQGNQKSAFRLSILGSGSSGNAALVDDGETFVLIDAGFSAVEIERRMAAIGLGEATLAAIVVTHEHSDHIQSAHTLSHRRKIPIFTTERTFEAKLATKRWHDFQIVRTGCSFQLGSMTFHPVSTPHDAADPFGLRIECQHASLAWISDLGYVTPLVKEALKGCDVVAFEANHDLAMLQNGPYPWETKQRIASRLGHLSNDDSLAALEEVLDERVGQVILTHLSETNNHASLLELRARQCFKQMGLTSLHLCLARQETPLSPLFISPKRLSDEGMSR